MDVCHWIHIFHLYFFNDNVNFTNLIDFSSLKISFRKGTKCQNVQHRSIFPRKEHYRNPITFHHTLNYSGNLLLYGWPFTYWRAIFPALFKFRFNVILWCITWTFAWKRDFGWKGCATIDISLFVADDMFFRIFQEQRRPSKMDRMAGIFISQ